MNLADGKFANGAAYAAFAAAVQAAADYDSKVSNGKFDAESLKERQGIAEGMIDKLYEDGVLSVDQRFNGPDAQDSLVEYLAPHMNAITKTTGLEVGGWVYQDAGGLGYTRPIVGYEMPLPGGGYLSAVRLGAKGSVALPQGGTLTATWHTHPSHSTFSIQDINNSIDRQLNHHVFTKGGAIYRRLWRQNTTCVVNAPFSLARSVDGGQILSCGSY